MKTKTNVKAGVSAPNHNQGLRVKTNVKSGSTLTPPVPTGMVIKFGYAPNHNQTQVRKSAGAR